MSDEGYCECAECRADVERRENPPLEKPDLIGWHVDAEPCLRSVLDGAECFREHVTDLGPFERLFYWFRRPANEQAVRRPNDHGFVPRMQDDNCAACQLGRQRHV